MIRLSSTEAEALEQSGIIISALGPCNLFIKSTWKKDASTSRKHRVLNTRPITLTRITGVNFFATDSSGLGISTRGVIFEETCSSITAMESWIKRKSNGRSGSFLKTALFLRKNEALQENELILDYWHEYHLHDGEVGQSNDGHDEWRSETYNQGTGHVKGHDSSDLEGLNVDLQKRHWNWREKSGGRAIVIVAGLVEIRKRKDRQSCRTTHWSDRDSGYVSSQGTDESWDSELNFERDAHTSVRLNSFSVACSTMFSFLSFKVNNDPENGPVYSNYSTRRSRRRQLACISLGGLSVVIFLFMWHNQPHIYWQPPISSSPMDHPSPHLSNLSSMPQIPELDALDPLAVLNGPPAEKFRGACCIIFVVMTTHNTC